MRILFLITRADTIGGAQIHVRDLASTLLQNGHQVRVCTGRSGAFNQVLTRSGIPNVTCPSLDQPIRPLKDGRALAALTRTIRKFQPQIVSTHSSKAGILGRLASKVTATPCLFTAHGWAFTDGVPQPQRSYYRWLEKAAAPLAENIICVSECDRQLAIAAGINPVRLLTIHNGMPDIPQQLRASPNSEASPIRIIMVARFGAQKDHATLIRALQAVPNTHLDLLGDGPLLAEMQQLVHQLSMENQVKFWGLSDQVAELMARAQIFALISNWEGFPRTILEAMRAGLPVIASDVGGVSEAVVDGVTGYCIPRGDVARLRQKLSELVGNANLRGQMGRAGRQHYESNFTFEKMYRTTYTLYEKILARRAQKS